MQETIEILSPEILDRHRSLVIELRRLARSLGLELGWHYLLDLSWVLSRLGAAAGKRVLDAGAGMGILQWVLAEQGAEVVSVDRESRAAMPLRFRLRYRVRGMRPTDLSPFPRLLRQKGVGWGLRQLVKSGLPRRAAGNVVIYHQNLMELTDVSSDSLDFVVGISSLEHNPPTQLGQVIAELMRVLKPGGALLVTLCAAGRDHDWFHQPSKGWCYTEASLRRAFSLSADVPSNYDQYDNLFAALRACAELRDNLAAFYAKSGDNGMPWGVWNPQYQPVGVYKVKVG